MAATTAKHFMIDDNRLTGAIFNKTIFEMAISNPQKMTDHVQLNIRNVLKYY